ncbi:MAG: DNA repair protein RecO [Candidatus Peribacteraceae bacterium]|nr:DNA repair protein RecO [Candidatus Peribacteraceae bacterium]MDD5742804.1 DNA repair protein RecO [Candidatus Peribacteraceae bacterium]
MPHARTFDCIVLASYDVGEADRFVILLTREAGRLAARVPGARRLKSRLAALLPLTHCSVELKETRGNFIVSGIAMSVRSADPAHLQNFLARTQMSEVLLALLSDGEPVSEIFEALSKLLHQEHCCPLDFLAFTFRVLALLGVLPETTHHLFAALSPEERVFVQASMHGKPVNEAVSCTQLRALSMRLLQEHCTRPLRSADIAAACSAA